MKVYTSAFRIPLNRVPPWRMRAGPSAMVINTSKFNFTSLTGRWLLSRLLKVSCCFYVTPQTRFYDNYLVFGFFVHYSLKLKMKSWSNKLCLFCLVLFLPPNLIEQLWETSSWRRKVLEQTDWTVRYLSSTSPAKRNIKKKWIYILQEDWLYKTLAKEN